MAGITADDLPRFVGPTAQGEYAGAAEVYQPQLLAWVATMDALEDTAFVEEASVAISSSALVQSFRGNWNHEHFKATACYDMARRHLAAGHTPECRGDTLYSRAYKRSVREAGHPNLAGAPEPCDCKQ